MPSGGLHTYKVAAFYSNGEVYFAAPVECYVFLRAGGSGTVRDPFLIATAGQLIALAQHPNLMDQHFRLVRDIDLDPNLPGRQIFDRAVIAPDTSDMDEGFQGSAFTGTFDGSDHTVSNLTIEGGSYLGLFGAVGPEAKVVDLNVVNIDVIGYGWNIGAIAGYSSGTVQDCYSNGLVMGHSDVGGLVGSNNSAYIINSHSDTDVVGIEYVGGLVGSHLSDYSDEAAVYSSNAMGSVFGWQWVGGLVGFNQGTVSKCSSSSFINGSSFLGGLVGYNDITGLLSNCYSSSTVRGEDTLGGLVGGNAGSLCFTYSIGEVIGMSGTGGLVGKAYTQAEVVASFWDVDISGQSSSEGGIGLTTAELQDVNTYLDAGWDFAGENDNGTENIWYIVSDNYAQFFSFEGIGTPENPYQIQTVWHLTSIGSDPNMLDKHFKLTKHINLDPNQLGSRVFTSAVIAPDVDPSNDSYEGVPFSGTFDGCGYEIHNMRIRGYDYLGLFGRLDSAAHVSNLSVINGSIEIGDPNPNVFSHEDHYQGLLAGFNDGNVEMCHTRGSISGRGAFTGGLIGENHGNVSHCTSAVDIDGSRYCGGLVGRNREGQIVDCHSTGDIIHDSTKGGLVGINYAYVGRCYATGHVMGNSKIGGLVGENMSGGTVEQCYSTGSVAGILYSIGGLVGESNGEIRECYSIGAVVGVEDDDVGGLVGSSNRSVTHSFWNTETSGQSSSAGGYGMSTAQMQDIDTYLNAGWDFFALEFDGMEDTWVMDAYPVHYMSQLLGDGSRGSPYLISENNKFIAFRNVLRSAHYRLTEDIDLSGNQWSGPVFPHFSGSFDGNGFAIRNLTIMGSDYLGLFRSLGRDATIKNLTIENVIVEGSGDRIGGLVGRNSGLVTNCYCTGVVTGDEEVGGLVGSNEGHVTNCSSSATVTGDYGVGGVVGRNGRVGGGLEIDGNVIRCYSSATVNGGGGVGGVVGENDGDVMNCHSIATVSGESTVGGLLGRNSGTVRESFAGGNVCTNKPDAYRVGGLVGSNSRRRIQNKSGPARESPGAISRCYSTASVRGNSSVGGLVGRIVEGGSISNSYSTGAVTGNRDVGGLLGLNMRDAGIVSGFWDVETSGQPTSAGGIGKTTAEMQTATTFLEAGWDFEDETENGTEDIWWIDEGQDYPRLWWEASN